MLALSEKTWKIIGYCAAGLVLLAIVLFTMHSCGNFLSGRDINKARENVNAALVEVNAAKGTVANDRIDEAIAIEKVKEAANDVITASNATDEAKIAANGAVANWATAKNANLPVGTSEDDLRRKLEALNQ